MDVFGIVDGLLQCLYVVEVVVDYCGLLVDVEVVCQVCLVMYLVFYCNYWEVCVVDFVGCWIDVGGVVGFVVIVEVVEGNDEEFVGVDWFVWIDVVVLLVWFVFVDVVVVGGVVVVGEGVVDQYCVVLCGIQFVVGFDYQVVFGQGFVVGQFEWFVEVQCLGGDQIDGVVGEDCGY